MEINKWEIVVSIKQVLEKSWEDCRKEGVELESVNFDIQRYIGVSSEVSNAPFSGNALKKPQNKIGD